MVLSPASYLIWIFWFSNFVYCCGKFSLLITFSLHSTKMSLKSSMWGSFASYSRIKLWKWSKIQWSLWKTSLPLSFGVCPKWGAALLCQAPHSPQGKQHWLPGSSFCSSNKALEKRWQHLSFSLKQSKQRAQRVYAGMYVSVYMPALFLETLTVGKWENKVLNCASNFCWSPLSIC